MNDSYITELILLLPGLLSNVVAIPEHGLLMRLSGCLARDVELTRGAIDSAELHIGDHG